MKKNKYLEIMRILCLNILLIIISVNFATAQTKSDKIDSLINDYYKKGMFNGSVIVSDKGKIIYKNGFGYANNEWNIENKTDTKFKIGSCTKQFTAVIIMMLCEEGKINLESKISEYYPNYPVDKANKITVHNLLCHTSGIPEYISLPNIIDLAYKENNPDDFVKVFWDLELEFEPGTKLKYSNSGYFVLGKIIENVTGKPYSQVLKEKIFDHLKMSNSGVIKDNVVLKKKAYGYIKAKNDIQVAPPINASGAFSAGAIYSTVEDLFKWQLALQSYSILSKESLDKMLTPNFSRYGYGFGILKRTLKTGRIVTLYGHEGQFFGFRSLIHIIKEDNSSVILLDNNQNSNLFEISTAIRNVIYESS